ncbi:MAG: fumarylacetoacetate hydrolase family protein [Xanthomonadales bacterium]|nr:fumarylacetoacetate hydrolase family protein [Xanthomonadales bacterium]
MSWLFEPAATPSLAVHGESSRFPLHRIYCIGRNYAAHAREMGASVDREHPLFFCKPADAVVTDDADVPYPSATHDLHHEVELVVAIGRDAEGPVEVEQATSLIYGYTVGLDLTRRDLQGLAKAKSHPWDVAKAFDASAPIGALRPGLPPADAAVWLRVNDSLRQQAALRDMVWSIAEMLAELSRLFRLRAGDLVFTGTPEGVAALHRGDRFVAGLDGEELLSGRIV